jgi:alkylation response protein AidB-like acyl-CoA dehydrogenase
MELADTPEQADLRDTVAAFARRYATPERVRTAMASPAGHDQETWRRLSGDLGLTALAVPEQHGGTGAGPAEVAVAVAELGRVLLPSPYLSTAIAALVLADAAGAFPGAAERYLPGLADGSTIGALVLAGDVAATGETITGVARNVVDGGVAGLLLVRATDRLLAVAAADAVVEPVQTLDQTRRQAVVRFDGAPAMMAGPADYALALYRVLSAAECVAAAEHCLASTAEYLRTRRQFGRPIGSFQALKHRCADLAVAVAAAGATARAAVCIAAANPADPAGLAVVAPLAALYCSRMFVDVTAEMIQLHGGIGFTWEHEAHLYFKRAKSTQLLLGPVSELRTEIGQKAGLIGHGRRGRGAADWAS